MPLLTRLFERRSSPENPTTDLANPDAWLVDWMTGGRSYAGPAVNETTALSVTAVWAALKVLSEDLASLPLPVYERGEGGRRGRATGHSLYPILHDRPNPDMSSMVMREMMQAQAMFYGSAYAEIQMNGRGEVVALWPLLSANTRVIRDETGRRFVEVMVNGKPVVLRADQVLHIQGFSLGGLTGLATYQRGREAIGLTLAANEFGSRYFGNGSRASGVLTHPKNLSDTALEHLRTSWDVANSGLSNAHRAVILEEGMTWQQTSIPPEEAQFLETRKFQVSEIARLWRIPPHMLADLERATFSNIEQQSIGYVVNTLRPWAVRWEQAMNWELFTEAERGRFYAEHVVDGLLRGDALTRAAVYASGRQWGYYSANDIRDRENENPIEGGDVYLVPTNMVPADQLGAAPPAATADPVRTVPVPRLEPLLQPLLQDVAGRVLRYEAGAVRKALRKSAGGRDAAALTAWVESFYREHAGYWVRTLMPALSALAPEGAAELAARIAESEAGASAEQLRQMARDTAPEEIEALIERRLAEWEGDRAAEFARRASSTLANGGDYARA